MLEFIHESPQRAGMDTGLPSDFDGNFDSRETAEMLGLSEKQRLLAEALRLGASQTEAARRAGYSGDGAALRSQASKASKSPKVRNYLDAASLAGAGPSDEIGDMEDLKRHLWRIVRGQDRAASLRSAEILSRVSALEADKPKLPRRPAEILHDVASYSAALAAEIARTYGLDLPSDLRERADAQRREIALGWFNDHPNAIAELSASGTIQRTVALEANGSAMPSPAGPGGARHE
jgi:phage terminase small subunit